MAVWQYHIFIVPEEEIKSFFKDAMSITNDDLNEIDWWKYSQLDLDKFKIFEKLLMRKKSWSKDIILFGEEDSDCVEILMDNKKIVEVSARIDLRHNYKNILNNLCDFAQSNNCIFLNDSLNIIYPNILVMENDILKNNVYKNFLDKFI